MPRKKNNVMKMGERVPSKGVKIAELRIAGPAAVASGVIVFVK